MVGTSGQILRVTWQRERFKSTSTPVVLILIVLTSVTASANIRPIMASSTLSPLKVLGNRIVDINGSQVFLRGVGIEEPFYVNYFPNLAPACNYENNFAELSNNWHINIVRVPVLPDLWAHDPSYAETLLDPIVNLGAKYGMYILLSWFAHGNAVTGQVEIPDWANQLPYHGDPYNNSLSLATDFLGCVAERYKGDPWVIFSVFSEPWNISWDEWRPVAEQLVDVVHSHNPSALVLVPGVSWANDLRGVANNPVVRDNIVYDVHPYVMSSVWYGPWEQCFGFLANRYPIFAGEWGFQPGFASDPNLNGTVENYGRPLLTYMVGKGMSWTAWCWSEYWSPLMIASLYVPTVFGQFFKDAQAQLIPALSPKAYIDSISPNPAIQGKLVLFSGHGTAPNGSIVAYNWLSSIDGQLGTSASFNTSSLSVGAHTIYFTVEDNSGAWSTKATGLLTINTTSTTSGTSTLTSNTVTSTTSPTTTANSGRLFSNGFEAGTYSGWSDQAADSHSSYGINSTIVHSGSYSSKHVTGVDWEVSRTGKSGFNVAAIYARIYVYYPALPASGKFFIPMGLFDSSWNTIGKVEVDANYIYLYNGIASEDYHTAYTFQSATWYCIEMWIQTGATTGAGKIWINGVLEVNASSKNFGTNNIDNIQVGNLWCFAGTAFIDDVEAGSSYIGPLSTSVTTTTSNTLTLTSTTTTTTTSTPFTSTTTSATTTKAPFTTTTGTGTTSGTTTSTPTSTSGTMTSPTTLSSTLTTSTTSGTSTSTSTLTSNTVTSTTTSPTTTYTSSTTSGTTTSTPIAVPSSTLAINPLGHVFFIFNNKKYYITDPAAFNSYGLSYPNVKNYTVLNPDNYNNSQISYDYLLDAKLPLPNKPYIVGDVNDGSLYYIPYYTGGGMKYPISGAGYNAYSGFLKTLPIRYGDTALSLTTSSTLLDGTNPIPPATPPSFTIGENPLGRIFFIFNNEKYYFTNWTNYLSYGFTSSNIDPSINPDNIPTEAQISFNYILEDTTSALRKPLPNQSYIAGDVNDGSLYWIPYFTWAGSKYSITGAGFTGYSGQLETLQIRYDDPAINLQTSTYILDGVNPLPQLVS